MKGKVALMDLVIAEQAKIDPDLSLCIGVEEPKGKNELHFHFYDGCSVEIHTDVTDNPQHIALAAALSHARAHGKAPEQVAARPQVAQLIHEAVGMIEEEALRAAGIMPAFNSGHEGKAVIEEELDELWTAVKRWPNHDLAEWKIEATQVGAMAARFLADLVLPKP